MAESAHGGTVRPIRRGGARRDKHWHRVFHPPNTLKDKVGPGNGISDQQLARAEAAVAGLQSEYRDHLHADVERLRGLFELVAADLDHAGGHLKAAKLVLFDMLGLGGSFGYPLASRVSKSLFEFLDGRERLGAAELVVAASHVDTLSAISAEDIHGDGGAVGRELIANLVALVARHIDRS